MPMVSYNPYRAEGKYTGAAYVSRSADTDLTSSLARNRRYPYVLAPRQSGKSSLINRIRDQLHSDEIASTLIDLNGFRPEELSDYDQFLARLARDCTLSLADDWRPSPRDRYMKETFSFLLGKTERRVVVFLDEIDSLRNCSFKNDFFSGLRSLFHLRDDKAPTVFNRLQFVLSGAGLPEDLIKDEHRSPFNVGERIVLRDLTANQVHDLARFLPIRDETEKQMVSKAIYRWTDGIVYLAHWICERAWDLASDGAVLNGNAIETVVGQLLARSPDLLHFGTVYNQVDRTEGAREALIRLYRDDPLDPKARRLLESTGIIAGFEEHGAPDRTSRLRCPIYDRVFGYRGPFCLIPSNARAAPQDRTIREFDSPILAQRIRSLFGLVESESGAIDEVARLAGLDRTTIQRYLKGERAMRLANVGKVFEGLRQYFLSRPRLRSSISFELLDARVLAKDLATSEYESYGVGGSQELHDRLVRDVADRMPRLDFRPVVDEEIDKYERSELFTKQLYIPLTARTQSGQELGCVEDHLLAFASDQGGGSVLFLLGDTGTGKTTTVKHFEYLLLQEFKKRPNSVRLPIYVNLRQFNRHVNVERFLISVFVDDLGLELERGYDDIRRLVESGRLIFLLDGFDEMSERITTVEIERNLEEIKRLNNHPNNKIVLSARTHLYTTDNDILKAYNTVTGTAPAPEDRSRLIKLNRFTEADWNLYLSRACGDRAEECKRKIATLNDYETVVCHPLLLRMTTEVLPKLVTRDDLKRTDLFYEYVSKWLSREEWRCTLNADQRLRLAEELAWFLFIHNLPCISFHELQDLAHEFFPHIRKGRDVDIFHHEVRTASFLHRNEQGEFSFVSPVFQFYFLARAISGRIARKSPIGIGRNILEDAVLDLLAEMQPDTNTLLVWSSQQIDRVKHEMGPHLAQNAKAILARINRIRLELIDKLDGVRRKSEFIEDPILADIANTVLPTLSKPIRTVDIFQRYVDPWFDEQATQFMEGADKCEDGQERGPEGRLHFVVEEMAWVLYLKNESSITPEDLRYHISNGLDDVPESSILREQFTSCPFLIPEGGGFMFRHSYLFNYFLALAILQRIRDDHQQQVGRDPWLPHVRELLSELEPSRKNLEKWIELTRKPDWNRQDTGPYLASNAVSLLHLLGMSFQNYKFDDAKLPKAELPGVDLSGLSLARVNLAQAKLSGANLKEANLSGANLERADLGEAVLTRANLIDADLSHANLTGAYLTAGALAAAKTNGAILRHVTEIPQAPVADNK